MSEAETNEKLLEIAKAMTQGEFDFQRLICDLRKRVTGLESEIKRSEDLRAGLKLKIASSKGSLAEVSTLLTVLENYQKSVGLNEVARVPTGGPRDPETGEFPTELSPIQKEVQDRRGKICLHRHKNKWCPTKITKKRANQGLEYCAKHQDWAGD